MDWLWFTIFSIFIHKIYSHETLNVDTKKCINVVSGGFLSMTVDPLNLIQTKIYTENMLEMAKSLSPSFLRICGETTDFLHFGDKYATVKTEDVDSVMKFIRNANLDLILALNINDRDIFKKEWDYTSSQKLINYMAEKGYLSSFQLGENTHGFNGYQIGKDVLKLKQILDKHPIYQQSFILGPDFRNEDALIMKDFLSQSGDTTSFSVISKKFHENDNVENELKSLRENLKKSVWNTKDLMGMMTPLKPIALADKESSNGSFVEAKMLAKILGSAAKLQYEMVLRKPGRKCLTRPTSEYWFALLYKSLIGRKVFDAKLSTGNDKIHVYSHCASNVVKENLKIKGNYYTKGSLAIFGVNENSEPFELKLDTKPGENIHIYTLTEIIIEDNEYTLLNGEPLEIKNGIPGLKPIIVKNPKIIIPGDSIFFIIRPDAQLDSCPYVPFIAARASITRIYDLPELKFSKTKRDIKLLNMTEVEDKYKNLVKNFYSKFLTDMGLMPDKKDDFSVSYVTYMDHGWLDKLTDKVKKENLNDQSNKRSKRSLEEPTQEDVAEKVMENEEKKAINEEIQHEKEEAANEEAENKEQEENIDRALLEIAKEDTKTNSTKEPENIEDIKNEEKNQDLVMEDVLTHLEDDKESNCMPEEKIEQDSEPEGNSPIIMTAAPTHIQKINQPYQYHPTYKTQEIPMYQNPEVPMYQNQDVSSYKNPEVPSYKNLAVPMYQNQDISSYKNPEVPSYKNLAVPMYQNQDVSNYKNPEVPMYPNQDVSSYKNQDVSSYKNPEISSYKNLEVPMYQNQDDSTYKNLEIPIYPNQDVSTYKNQEVPIYQNQDVPSYKNPELPSHKNLEVPMNQNQDDSTYKNLELPMDQNQDVSSYKNPEVQINQDTYKNPDTSKYQNQDIPSYKNQDKNEDLSEKKENYINKIMTRIISKEDAEYANKHVDPSKEGTVEEMESPMVEVVLPETNDKLFMPLKNAEFDDTPRYLDNGDDIDLPTENQPTTKVQREINLHEKPLFNRAHIILEESPVKKIKDYVNRVIPKKIVQPIEEEDPIYKSKTIEAIKNFIEQKKEEFEEIRIKLAEAREKLLESAKILDNEDMKSGLLKKNDVKDFFRNLDLSEKLKLNIPSLSETASRLRSKRDLSDVDEYEKQAKKFLNENIDKLKDTVSNFMDRFLGKRNKRSDLSKMNNFEPNSLKYLKYKKIPEDNIDIMSRVSKNYEIIKKIKEKDEIGQCKESGQTEMNKNDDSSVTQISIISTAPTENTNVMQRVMGQLNDFFKILQFYTSQNNKSQVND